MRILVTEPIHDQGIGILKSCGEVIHPTSTDKKDLISAIKDCDAVLTRVVKIDKELIDHAPKLKAIAKHGVGVDNIDVEYATAKKILVLNAPYSNLNAVAEHAVMFMLSLMRNTFALNIEVKHNNYANARKNVVLQEFTHKKIGFVGFGKIPQRIKELLAAFNPKFMAYDPYAQSKDWLDVEFVPSLEELFKSCLIVSVHTPLTPTTANIINAEILKNCNKSYLINTSRGGIVDEQAVVKALNEGRLAGYGTDVFDKEPPAIDHELIMHPLVLCSPHCAALTDHALINMAVDAASGIKSVLTGNIPQYIVNK